MWQGKPQDDKNTLTSPGIARVAGETAPIMFTAAYVVRDQLPWHIYVVSSKIPQNEYTERVQYGSTLIDGQTPAEKQLHLIADNYSTHKHAEVMRWLEKHPRFHMHFTPTSASWLNMVERFFRGLTLNRLRRGIFKSLEQLHEAIEAYLAGHNRNRNPKPFIWTANASDILAKVQRARSVLPIM